MEKNNFLRVSGLLLFTGTAILFLVDYQLLYMPLPVKQYSTFEAAMAHSDWAIHFYSKLGVLGAIIALPGLYFFYLVSARTNKMLAWATVIIYAIGYANAAIYYGILSYVMSMAKIISPLHVTLPFFTRHIYYLFQGLYFTGIIGGSVFFFITVMFKKGNIPEWFVSINPLFQIGFYKLVLVPFCPPAISGFLLPTSYNLAVFSSVGILLVYLWNKDLAELIGENFEVPTI